MSEEKPASAPPPAEPGAPKAKRTEAKREVPKRAAPAPRDPVQERLVRFVAVRTRERYPETRRLSPGPVEALVRSRVEEHPELLDSYRKNRRRGEQEALSLASALAEELAGRAPPPGSEAKK